MPGSLLAIFMEPAPPRAAGRALALRPPLWMKSNAKPFAPQRAVSERVRRLADFVESFQRDWLGVLGRKNPWARTWPAVLPGAGTRGTFLRAHNAPADFLAPPSAWVRRIRLTNPPDPDWMAEAPFAGGVVRLFESMPARYPAQAGRLLAWTPWEACGGLWQPVDIPGLSAHPGRFFSSCSQSRFRREKPPAEPRQGTRGEHIIHGDM
jgi:hypothetical protein